MDNNKTSSYRILIVEDEVLIADTIQRYIEKAGHHVIGSAISFEEGRDLFEQHKPDLILIDIHLNSKKSGIDLAHYIRLSESPKPFIYLTAQADPKSLQLAKETFPAGYLSKPIQKQSLVATIEIGMHKFIAEQTKESILPLSDGRKKHLIPISNILYLQSEHVYVKVHLEEEVIIHRAALKELLSLLPVDSFIQTHRSYAVNIKKISNWDFEHIYIQGHQIPISRSKKKEIIEILNQWMNKQSGK